MSKRRSLLEKYDIDIKKLDYSYIETCDNEKELERIYKILLSNEEGYYPDLTETAKKRLATVKPNSKCLRGEEHVLKRSSMEAELQDKVQCEIDNFLKAVTVDEDEKSDIKVQLELPLIPIRGENTIETVPINGKYPKVENSGRIEEIRMESLTQGQLSQLETDHRNRGNNSYRAKEYEEALAEYGRCIAILPTAHSYNNRAITNIKLKRYEEAMEDLNNCLALDSQNTKALLRKADLLKKTNRSGEALPVYEAIAKISTVNDENCAYAKEQIVKLTKDLIVKKEDPLNTDCQDILVSGLKKELAEADYAKLVLPKKIVPSKSKQLVESFRGMNKGIKKKATPVQEQKQTPSRSLIEEI